MRRCIEVVFSTNVLKVLAPILAVPVHAYICRQQDRLQSQAKRLGERDRIAVEGYFRPEVLDRVRVLLADPLPIPDPPFASVIRRFGFDFLSPSMAEGITFDHVIACRGGLNPSLLFHELVHVVQYQILGVMGFARQYVRGFLETRSYAEIPLERSAFDLQFRFESEPGPFDVDSEVRRFLGRR